MSTHRLESHEDIHQFPTKIEALDAANPQITIGDFHGNAMKLIFMLIKHQIAEGITGVDYEKLVDIYTMTPEELTTTDIEAFCLIINKLQMTNKAVVRLIGDELADRGSNDYFTLKVLEKLHQEQVPVEIMLSNHSIEFIYAYEQYDEFKACVLHSFHLPSMLALEHLISNGLVTREEVTLIIKNVYKPTLRVLSYTLSEDKQAIVIYTHAPVGLETIASLAKKMQVTYESDSAPALAKTIDAINNTFRQHVSNNMISSLYTYAQMDAAYEGRFIDPKTSPFVFIMWNRDTISIYRPEKLSGYTLHFVHGHDCRPISTPQHHNLDTSLGKWGEDGGWNESGTYKVLLARGTSPSLQPIDMQAPKMASQLPEAPAAAVTQSARSPASPAQEAQLGALVSSLSQPPKSPYSQSPGSPCPRPPESRRIPAAMADSAMVDRLTQVNEALQLIADKEEVLREKGARQPNENNRYLKAADCANNLIKEIKEAQAALVNTPNALQKFKNTCLQSIKQHGETLKQHRGWKQLLGNLTLAILGVGVLYAAAGLIHKAATGRFLFFKTDSHQKLERLSAAIDEIKVEQSAR